MKNVHPWLVRRIGVALAALLFSGVAAATTLSFDATLGFTEQVGAGTVGCFLTGTISGEGSATRLGSLSLASADCINPISASSFLFVSDKVVLGVADGDQIWAAYAGALSATDGTIHGTYFVFGGTGRFKHAKGLGTIAGAEAIDFDTGTGTGQIQLKGTLTY